MASKTFLVGLVLVLKQLCRYVTVHQASITRSVNDSSLTADQKAIVLTFLTTIQAPCTILEVLTGY